MQLDEIIKELCPLLKEKGYTKSRRTWRKYVGDITLFFSIQMSQYSQDEWFYYFGITINTILSGKKAQSISNCHLWERLDFTTNEHIWTANELFYLIERWETLYGSVDKLHTKTIEGKLPAFAKSEVIKYLSTWYR